MITTENGQLTSGILCEKTFCTYEKRNDALDNEDLLHIQMLF